MSYKWLEWAQRIQSISQAGLTFSSDAFDRERYEELRTISAEIMASHSKLEMQKIQELFVEEKGYPTPKIDVRGVVFQDDQILLVKETHDNKWALPGGFCEIGLSAAENVVKEIQEESGYVVQPKKLVALMDMNRYSSIPQAFHYYKVFIQCEIVGGQPITGIETAEIGFFAENDLPELSVKRNTEEQIQILFEFQRNPYKEAWID
ncbi:NUDIX hydrolase [Sporosarcina aquimarina]|uniref:NUDIX hydrolase n=1 Tax=Sporosarcina aquimarina TaxID=114975 RepID=UPI00203A4F34|nr:NUDIX hydrolase [Sporosarcina aquimarina]MCM3757975.1 NUDIX hydrolase [Sporosarcina aquimarina]